jgi:hypothetical protein
VTAIARCDKCGKPVMFVLVVKNGTSRLSEWHRCAEHTWVALTLLSREEVQEVRSVAREEGASNGGA